MTDDRSAHDVWMALSDQGAHLLDAHRLAVALRELHISRMAAADPTLIDDQWNLLFETLLDRLKAETATAKDIFARACESMSGRCRSRLKAV